MRKILTSNKREIKDTEFDYSSGKKEISFAAFSKGVLDFSSEHLSGLLEVDRAIQGGGMRKILIDPQITALLFKELLLHLKGREIIYVKLACYDKYALAEIYFPSVCELKDSEREALTSIAARAGFDIEFSDKIMLKTKAMQIAFALVYAISASKISKILDNVIFD